MSDGGAVAARIGCSDLAGRTRDERRAWATPGSSHDRLIRTARIGLPLAIAALALFLTAAPFTSGRDISFVLAKDQVAVAKERLRVSRALYRGQDAKGRAFALRADSAVQASSRDPVVRLEKLSARLAMADGPATLVAGHGRYAMDEQRVALDGPVDFATADGYRVATQDVLVDLDTKRMESRGAVTGRTTLGTFSADRLSGNLEDRTLRLDGRARLHIVQRQSRGRR